MWILVNLLLPSKIWYFCMLCRYRTVLSPEFQLWHMKTIIMNKMYWCFSSKIFFYCKHATNKEFNFTYILAVSRSQRGVSDKWGQHCRMSSQNCLLDWTTGKLVIFWVVYFCTLILKHRVGLVLKFPFMWCYKQIIVLLFMSISDLHSSDIYTL